MVILYGVYGDEGAGLFFPVRTSNGPRAEGGFSRSAHCYSGPAPPPREPIAQRGPKLIAATMCLDFRSDSMKTSLQRVVECLDISEVGCSLCNRILVSLT